MATSESAGDTAAVTATNTGESGQEEETFLTPERLKLIGYGAAALAVVALIAWFMITSANRKEAFATEALEQARSVAESGNVGEAVQQFQQIATTYSGTSASSDAIIGMAQARLIAGQAELAVSTLEDFLADGPPQSHISPANGLLGTAYENTKRYSEAKDSYLKASETATIDFLKATLLLDAGRAALASGAREEAISIYTRISTDFGETAANSEAVVRLNELQPNI